LEQTASNCLDGADKHRVIHPCHPLSGYEFDPIRLFNNLGTLRVEFIGPDGKQLSLPASCTTLAAEDPYTHFAGPETLFRFPDLIALSELMGLMRETRD
jgi:hypothetical protein